MATRSKLCVSLGGRRVGAVVNSVVSLILYHKAGRAWWRHSIAVRRRVRFAAGLTRWIPSTTSSVLNQYQSWSEQGLNTHRYPGAGAHRNTSAAGDFAPTFAIARIHFASSRSDNN